MATGRGRVRTAEAEHAADQTGSEPPAGSMIEQPERTAHGWEFDEADSWEPVVPDTWQLPAEGNEPAEAPEVPSDARGSAGWTDAARADEEWVDAARHAGTEPRPSESGAVPYLESVAAQYLGDEPVPTKTPRRSTRAAAAEPEQDQGSNAARMALGLATLAAQRLRGGVPVGDGFVTGVGLAQETANGLRELSRRVLEPATRMAAGAVKSAAVLPVAGMPVRAALRTRDRLSEAAAGLRARGTVAVEVGRADAERMLREQVDRTVRWATDHAVTPLVERLAPRVAEHVLPHVVADVAGRVTGGGSPEGRKRR